MGLEASAQIEISPSDRNFAVGASGGRRLSFLADFPARLVTFGDLVLVTQSKSLETGRDFAEEEFAAAAFLCRNGAAGVEVEDAADVVARDGVDLLR